MLIERRGRGGERGESESVYGVSTDGEAERHGDEESEQQASGASDDEADAQSDGHMSADDASALPGSASGGVDCDSSDQQGHVLPFVIPFGYDPSLRMPDPWLQPSPTSILRAGLRVTTTSRRGSSAPLLP